MTISTKEKIPMINKHYLLISALAFNLIQACSLGENIFSGNGSDAKKDAPAAEGSDLVKSQELVDKELTRYLKKQTKYIEQEGCRVREIEHAPPLAEEMGIRSLPPCEQEGCNLEEIRHAPPLVEEEGIKSLPPCEQEDYSKFSLRICKKDTSIVVSSRPAENEAGHEQIEHGCYFVTCVAQTSPGGGTDEMALDGNLKDREGYKSKINADAAEYFCQEVEPFNPDEPKEEVREECKVFQERAQRACTAVAFEKYIRCEASYAPNKDSDKSQLFEAQSDANCDLDGDGGKAHAIDQLNFQICQAGVDNPRPITAKALCETKSNDFDVEE